MNNYNSGDIDLKINSINLNDLLKNEPSAPEEPDITPKGIIFSFIENKISNQQEKLNKLAEKNTTLSEKIQKNQDKIIKFKAKINKFEKQNKFLKAVAQAYPKAASMISSIITKNNNKINLINSEKIPNKLEKNNKYTIVIEKNSQKIKCKELKIKTLINMQDYVSSFKINDAEQRHDKFMQCLNSLNELSLLKITNKLTLTESKISDAQDKYNTNEYMIRQLKTNPEKINSAKVFIQNLENKSSQYQNKISNLNSRVNKLNNKLETYNVLESGISTIESQPKEIRSKQIEEIMNKNEAAHPDIAEAIIMGNTTVSALSYDIINSNSELVSEVLDKVKYQEPRSNIKSNEIAKKTSKQSRKNTKSKEKTSIINKLKENEKSLTKNTPIKENIKSKDIAI